MQQWGGTAKIASPSATPPLHTVAAEIDIYKSSIPFVASKFAFRFFESSMQLSVGMYGLALNVTIKENVNVSFE